MSSKIAALFHYFFGIVNLVPSASVATNKDTYGTERIKDVNAIATFRDLILCTPFITPSTSKLTINSAQARTLYIRKHPGATLDVLTRTVVDNTIVVGYKAHLIAYTKDEDDWTELLDGDLQGTVVEAMGDLYQNLVASANWVLSMLTL
jgi:hypothetical protein